MLRRAGIFLARFGNIRLFDISGICRYNIYIENLNPIRYRSYYFDTETGLYWLTTRFYDPETGRFISQDEYSYLDPDSINGLNLFAYCGNNPIMLVDETGNKPKWWQWLLFGIGVALVVAAAVVLTVASGGAATGLIGAIAVGAAKGALIGAAIGSAVGIAGGAIYAGVTGANMGESILSGFLMGFGGGAIVGAVIGGAIGGTQFGTFASKSALNTHYTKHGIDMGFSSAKEYAKNAKYVIRHGTKVSYTYKGKITTGYIKFLGKGGAANYAFVGMNGTRVATFGPRNVAALIEMGITMFSI